jgi:hypothetical protein
MWWRGWRSRSRRAGRSGVADEREGRACLRLEHILQALIDTNINITITGCWNNGLDFSFVSLKSAIAHDTGHPEDIVPGEVVDCRTYPNPACWPNQSKPRFDTSSRTPNMHSAWRTQERAPQADIKPLSELDARYAYKLELTETLGKLYDSEIVPTISTDATFAARYIFTGGLDFEVFNYLQYVGDTVRCGAT